MEKPNLRKERVDKLRTYIAYYGGARIAEALVNASNEAGRPIPKWIIDRIEIDILSKATTKALSGKKVSIGERKVEVSSSEKAFTKGKEVSLWRLRGVLTEIDSEQFHRIAKYLIGQVWSFPTPLTMLHFMLKREMGYDMGRVKKGMLLKIIFTNNTFTYDRNEGITTVKRKLRNPMTEAHCVERARQKYVSLQTQLHDALKEVNANSPKSASDIGDLV